MLVLEGFVEEVFGTLGHILGESVLTALMPPKEGRADSIVRLDRRHDNKFLIVILS